MLPPAFGSMMTDTACYRLLTCCRLMPFAYLLPPATLCSLAAACYPLLNCCRLLPFAFLLPPACGSKRQQAASGNTRQYAGGSRRQQAATSGSMQAAAIGTEARCGIVKASLSRFIAVFTPFYILLDMPMIIYAILVEGVVWSRLPHSWKGRDYISIYG